MAQTSKTYTGWAIEGRSRGPLSSPAYFEGRYSQPADIPAHMEGHVISLFKSRSLARKARHKRWDVNGNYHWYVPVKVRVTVVVEE